MVNDTTLVSAALDDVLKPASCFSRGLPHHCKLGVGRYQISGKKKKKNSIRFHYKTSNKQQIKSVKGKSFLNYQVSAVLPLGVSAELHC